MRKFIIDLFIKKRLKQYRVALHLASVNETYLIVDLWNGKYYHSIPEYDLVNYTDIWDEQDLDWRHRGWLIMIVRKRNQLKKVRMNK